MHKWEKNAKMGFAKHGLVKDGDKTKYLVFQMRHFSFGFLRARAYGSEREGNFGLNYSM